MKKAFAFVLLFLGLSAQAQETKVLHTCTIRMNLEQKLIPEHQLPTLRMVGLQKGNEYFGLITNSQETTRMSNFTPVTYEEATVRLGLTADLDKVDELNLNNGELLISHAMFITQSPELKGMMKVPFDLRQVGFVRIYTYGEKTKFGSASIIQAYDRSNRFLGQFLGGMLVGECK